MAKIDAFLKKAYEIKASDFHLATGNPPMFRKHGRLKRIKYQELTSSLFLEMPPERSRLSDCLNFSPQFLYLCRQKGDIILNKSYVFSVKEKMKGK